ncbi:carboxymuconolactone decarboxylase family protein [Alteromonas lipolytica]|uniref:Carboxymuconolactone decarboxylase n=1 Tax=Alteromonas lipolytica TaxID=1856405 RepID=A0A1E8FFG4_9ALTE|nr:carboxymuconolactone decarboxylase family protein [Alteromonas lipolytica]OFI34675.1 carboxymuconolactone decarboxylase [Alteromonas lipolytica]GGF53089.1 alkyl hydroperoxide reductase AhpD [Alteromonas lipolytica]
MSYLTVHTFESAPDAAKPMLDESVNAFGFVPGLHGVMAEAPDVLESYKFLHGKALSTSFTKEEITVVWQTANVEHGCHYCVPAHTGIAKAMKVDDSITEALRNKTPLPEKLEVLRETTKAILLERGKPAASQVEAFFAAGYSQRQLLEIILVLAQKVMSNYINQLADTPVDKPFAKFAWHPA